MGSGSWTAKSFNDSVKSRGFSSVDSLAAADVRSLYTATTISPALNPYQVVRECRDSEEHPNTIPIILALDVTGSMGRACMMCAAKLNETIEALYKSVKDPQIMTMGIGDIDYDRVPLQATQFESDIRIFEQMNALVFEGGGGGNGYESYAAAWYFALHNTDIDAYNKRGQKGILVTLGDECPGEWLRADMLKKYLGSEAAEDMRVEDVYKAASEKFDIYHISISNESSYHYYKKQADAEWTTLMGDHYCVATSNELPQIIAAIVNQSVYETAAIDTTILNENGEITW